MTVVTNKADKIYDELLVLRCQDGEQMAFEILVQRWQISLIKFANVVCRDNDIATEAVQESWVSIIRGISKLRDPASFRYWALRIVHRKCIDLIRTNVRGQTRESATDPDTLSAVTAGDLDSLEDQQEITLILNSLSEAHRTVLALHYLHDMELTEIADLLDIPNGTVKSRLHHARDAFKKSLKHKEELHNG